MKKIQLYEVNVGEQWPTEEKLGERKARLNLDLDLVVNANDASKLLELLERSINFVAHYSNNGDDAWAREAARDLHKEIDETLKSNTIT